MNDHLSVSPNTVLLIAGIPSVSCSTINMETPGLILIPGLRKPACSIGRGLTDLLYPTSICERPKSLAC
jgi:hypothetical protein